VKHRLAAFAFGILIILVYATGAELRTASGDWAASARAALAAGRSPATCCCRGCCCTSR
jgi:hypothetical protein